MPHFRGRKVPIVGLSVFCLGVMGVFAGFAWYLDATMFTGGFTFLGGWFSGVFGGGLFGFCMAALMTIYSLLVTPPPDQSSSNNQQEQASTDSD